MRELTKSMMSFSWAMSLFGLRQMTCLLMPQSWRGATSSFDAMTRSTEDQLGSVTDSMFRAGDNLQRGLVDLMFGMFTLGLGGRNGNGRRDRDHDGGDAVDRSVRWGADVMQRTAEAGADFMQRTAQAVDTGADALRQEDVGWGPMPGSR